MRVVSDASPISNLAIIGRLDFLRARYTRVVIPPSARSELLCLSHAAGRAAIDEGMARWLARRGIPASAAHPRRVT